MNIKILGSGCPNCLKLAENVNQASVECNIDAQIEKITEIDQIISYGIMSTPAIIINDEIKASGRIPTVEEIKTWLQLSI